MSGDIIGLRRQPPVASLNGQVIKLLLIQRIITGQIPESKWLWVLSFRWEIFITFSPGSENMEKEGVERA